MNRRDFLKDGGLFAFAFAHLFPGVRLVPKAVAEQAEAFLPNTNWAELKLHAKASASSFPVDRPSPSGYYTPENVFGDNLSTGWQARGEATGAWIQINFCQLREVSELWLLSEPLPSDILGQNVYRDISPRAQLLVPPRRIRIGFSSGTGYTVELQQVDYFQISTFPKADQTSSVRITIEEVWPKPGGKETGVGKIRIFPHRHSLGFEVATYSMYDVHYGRAVQDAIPDLVNPGEAVQTSKLQVSSRGTPLMTVPLQLI